MPVVTQRHGVQSRPRVAFPPQRSGENWRGLVDSNEALTLGFVELLGRELPERPGRRCERECGLEVLYGTFPIAKPGLCLGAVETQFGIGRIQRYRPIKFLEGPTKIPEVKKCAPPVHSKHGRRRIERYRPIEAFDGALRISAMRLCAALFIPEGPTFACRRVLWLGCGWAIEALP